jgi:hypothetical protein
VAVSQNGDFPSTVFVKLIFHIKLLFLKSIFVCVVVTWKWSFQKYIIGTIFENEEHLLFLAKRDMQAFLSEPDLMKLILLLYFVNNFIKKFYLELIIFVNNLI